MGEFAWDFINLCKNCLQYSSPKNSICIRWWWFEPSYEGLIARRLAAGCKTKYNFGINTIYVTDINRNTAKQQYDSLVDDNPTVNYIQFIHSKQILIAFATALVPLICWLSSILFFIFLFIFFFVFIFICVVKHTHPSSFMRCFLRYYNAIIHIIAHIFFAFSHNPGMATKDSNCMNIIHTHTNTDEYIHAHTPSYIYESSYINITYILEKEKHLTMLNVNPQTKIDSTGCACTYTLSTLLCGLDKFMDCKTRSPIYDHYISYSHCFGFGEYL